MTTPTVPPDMHAEIQAEVDAIRVLTRKGVAVSVDGAHAAEHLQYLLNEQKNLRHTIAELNEKLAA